MKPSSKLLDDDSEEAEWWVREANLSSMMGFEKSLHCPICKEILDSPKCIKTCMHFFCDLCIAREFGFRNRCPVCKEDCSKSDLIRVPFVSDMVDLYRRARQDLIKQVSSTAQTRSGTTVQDSKITSSNGKNFVNTCSITESQESFDWSDDKKDKLPNICFSLLKNNQLKEYLKKYNLPVTGTRDQMVWRMKEFILRYNSNLDRVKPLSHEQIISSILKDEREREQLKSKSGFTASMFAINRRKDTNSPNSNTTPETHNRSESLSNASERAIRREVNEKNITLTEDSFAAIVLSPEDNSVILLTPPFKDLSDKEEEEPSPICKRKIPSTSKNDDTPTKWKKRCTVKIRTPASKQKPSTLIDTSQLSDIVDEPSILESSSPLSPLLF